MMDKEHIKIGDTVVVKLTVNRIYGEPGNKKYALGNIHSATIHIFDEKDLTGAEVEQATSSNYDAVNKPKHYQGRLGLEGIDVVRNFLSEEEYKGWLKGNTIKYILREANKNGLEDLKKAQKNLSWLIEEEEDEKV